MNGTESKIEIFTPFGAAFELMKKILFQPFDFAKWCVIGFAAFLSHLAGGSHFNFPRSFGKGDWNYHSITHNAVQSHEHLPGWAIPLIVLGVLVLVAVVLVLMWIGSRGKFIFTDCIVRNRGAISEPWREYRPEANSYFLFSLIVAFVIFGIIIVSFVPILLPFIQGWTGTAAAVTWSFGIVFVIGIIVIIALGWSLVSQLMVPVMYRQRCRARKAFGEVLGLISSHPGPIVLYLLFLLVLGVGTAMVGCLLACVTCCVTAIPYIGTVILLPIYVLLTGFSLTFLRQFGNQFDVWATAASPELPVA